MNYNWTLIQTISKVGHVGNYILGDLLNCWSVCELSCGEEECYILPGIELLEERPKLGSLYSITDSFRPAGDGLALADNYALDTVSIDLSSQESKSLITDFMTACSNQYIKQRINSETDYKAVELIRSYLKDSLAINISPLDNLLRTLISNQK